MTAAVVVYVLLAALAVFQVALIAGAPLGRYAWGGQHEVLPTRLRIGSAISVLIYAWIAAVIAYSVTLLDIPAGERLADPGIWIVTAYFAVDVPLNLASRSRPERLVMTPVVLILFVCCLLIALQ
jgi:hypothetical protein